MPCFHPIACWRALRPDSNGKRRVFFKGRKDLREEPDIGPGTSLLFGKGFGVEVVPIDLPCGGCDGCLVERSRQWAVRGSHEASMHTHNCMVTLTYDDDHMPPGGSLWHRDVQLFLKRMRKAVSREYGREQAVSEVSAARGSASRFLSTDGKVRYLLCGEYGDATGRPHYHLILFGCDFADRRFYAVRKGFQVWTSPTLDGLWGLGRAELGSVTFDSIAYVARYVLKKVRGPEAEAHYRVVDFETGEVWDREPEYVQMSRRPGIAAKWLEQFHPEVYRWDRVVMRGQEQRVPRYYDKQFEVMDQERMTAVKNERQRPPEDVERLKAREVIFAQKLSQKGRGL